jgi:hypothetical protein
MKQFECYKLNTKDSYLFMCKPQITHIFAEDFYAIRILTPTRCATDFFNSTNLKPKPMIVHGTSPDNIPREHRQPQSNKKLKVNKSP